MDLPAPTFPSTNTVYGIFLSCDTESIFLSPPADFGRPQDIRDFVLLFTMRAYKQQNKKYKAKNIGSIKSPNLQSLYPTKYLLKHS